MIGYGFDSEGGDLLFSCVNSKCEFLETKQCQGLYIFRCVLEPNKETKIYLT